MDRGVIEMIPKDPFEESVFMTQWALDKAWKIAVKTAGITDWSVTKAEHPERENQVEIMQMEIAKMILSNINATMERKMRNRNE